MDGNNPADPLIKVKDYENKQIDSDILHIFVFPNFFTHDEQLIKDLSVKKKLDWCHSIYKQTFKLIKEETQPVALSELSQEYESRQTKPVQSLSSVIKLHWRKFEEEHPGPEVEYYKFLKLLIERIIAVMEDELGLDLSLFYSVDKDEIFVTIKCEENNLRVQASLMEYHLQLNDSTYISDLDYRKIAPYGEFEHEAISQPGKKNLYKRYNSSGKWVKDTEEDLSFFQKKDKIRILLAIINSVIDMGILSENDIIVCSYSLHDDNLKKLREKWGNFGKFWKSQNLNKVRDYFGEKIAMYFGWLEYYIYWLVFPGIFGGTVFVMQYFYADLHLRSGKMSISDIILLIFCAVLAVGSTFLHQLWVRRQAELSWVWGTTDIHEIEVQRPGFKGDYGKDPITGQKKKLKSSTFWTNIKRIIAFLISLCFVLVTILIISLIMVYKEDLTVDLGFKVYKYGPMLNAFQIKIMNFTYRRIARKLNEWENYEYDSESSDSLARKLYLFQFINSYSSLFVIAFFKELLGIECEYGCTNTVNGCRKKCLIELEIQLATIFLINMFMNLIELGLPYLKSKLNIWSENRKLQKMRETTSQDYQELSNYEKERKLEDYETPLDDYMEIIIDFGYVVMFSAAFPPLAILAFIVNVFEVRVDSFKLCHLTRRPYPAPANSIGEWERVMKLVTILGTLTNTGIMVFTADIFHLNTYKEKWFYFLVIEHILLICMFVVERVIPDIPSIVHNGLKWQSRIAREKIYDKVSDVDELRHNFNLKFEKAEGKVVLDDDYIAERKPHIN